MELLKRTRPLLLRHKNQLIIIVLLVLAGAVISALLPWPLKVVVDNVLYEKPLPDSLQWLSGPLAQYGEVWLLVVLAVTGLALLIVQRLLQMLQGWFETGVGERLTYDLGEQLLGHLQKLSLVYHGNHQSGDLIRRVTTDSRCVQETVLGVIVPVMTSTSTLLMMFVIMWNLHIGLTLVAVAAALPIPWLIRKLSPKMTEFTYMHQQSEGKVMSVAEQTLTGLPVVQAFGQEARQHDAFKQLSEQSMRDYLKSIKAQLEFSVGVSSSTAVGTAAMLLVGGFAVLKGAITLGELLVFLTYVASLYGPIETLAYVSSTYAAAVARAQRVFEVLDEVPSVSDSGNATIPIRQTDAVGEEGVGVKFNDVSFAYKPEEPVLDQLSLNINAGETIAFVGSTGSGKSTAVSLIPRFYDPTLGSIEINGVDIKNVPVVDVRSQISMVLQDPYLLPISIADNIAYGKPHATRDEIVQAAKASNADEFITLLPLGYDTVLSEHGSDLSGGQRQRLSIARALLRDAPILILDEPTSALDVRTEALFFEALDNLMFNRTSFIIAHRLSTIRDADRIVVLEAGQIVEVGSHDELMEKQAHYYQLHQMQFGPELKVA